MAQPYERPTLYDGERSLRKRTRLLSRTDEEIRSEMDKRGLSYRAGWPTLPPLPMYTVAGPRGMIPDHTDKLQELANMLSAKGVGCGTPHFVFRVPVDAVDPDDFWPYLTCLYPTDTIKYSDRLVEIVVLIKSILKKYDSTNNIQIECIDWRAQGNLISFAIRHDDSGIRERWERTVPIILELLEQHEWLCLEMLRRGILEDPEKCPPTIVITTPTARNFKWVRIIMPAILAAIAHIAPDFKVEVLCGISLLSNGKNCRDTTTVGKRSYRTVVGMGSSIGIWGGDTGSGTLGGSVTLEDGVKCGITSWRCVRDDRLDKGMASFTFVNPQTNPNVVVSKTNDGALTIDNETLMKTPQRILSPSTKDHEGHMFYTERKYEYTPPENRSLGHVYAGSGRRTTTIDKYIAREKTEESKQERPEYISPVDWALIRMDNVEQRDIINEFPNDISGRPFWQIVAVLCNRWTRFNINNETVPVAKYGRTSGCTTGLINSCIARINPETNQKIAKAYGFTRQKPGLCFTAVPESGRGEFIEAGDSGSILVHDGSGAQLGLLFGVTPCAAGMFTPIDLVFQDIEKVTGKKVIDPVFICKLTTHAYGIVRS